MSIPKSRLLEFLNRLNQILERAIPVLIPAGVALGIALPAYLILLRPLIPWFFATITLAGALKLRARELGRTLTSPLPFFIFFFSARVFMPVIVFFLSSLIFRNDPDTVSGYVLLYSVPTAVTGFIWVSIFRGDSALALALILLDTILAPLVVPGTVRILLGASIRLDMTGLAVSLIYMIVIPTIVGVTLNEVSRGKIPALISPYLNPFSKICMALMVSANSAAIAPQIKPDNPRLWIIIITCISFSVFSFIWARFSGLAGKLKRDKQISLFFTAGLRNTGAAMTLGIEFFPGPAALPAVLGIMFQQITAAIMGRIFLGKIGSESTASKEAAM